MKTMQRYIAVVLVVPFLMTTFMPAAMASPTPWMPQPGAPVALTPAFTPAHLKGMVIHPNEPFKFDFIIDRGDKKIEGDAVQAEYQKLIKYFLAALATPDTDQWVNLSPFEQDRIIPDNFGLTEMGRDLLAQDYLLKQISASLTNPDTDLGKKFWNAVYRQAHEKFGTTDVPTDIVNKIWVTPDKADIYEKGNMMLVVASHLKVMTETDYLATRSLKDEAAGAGVSAPADKARDISLAIMREIIIPAIEKEVNEGTSFAPVRQIYSGMLLATWYKMALKESILAKVYGDRSKVKGIDQDPVVNHEIYAKYVSAFKGGVYNMIREDVDRYAQETIPRKYFSGGLDNAFAAVVRKVTDAGQAIGTDAAGLDVVNVRLKPEDKAAINNENVYGKVMALMATAKDNYEIGNSEAGVLEALFRELLNKDKSYAINDLKKIVLIFSGYFEDGYLSKMYHPKLLEKYLQDIIANEPQRNAVVALIGVLKEILKPSDGKSLGLNEKQKAVIVGMVSKLTLEALAKPGDSSMAYSDKEVSAMIATIEQELATARDALSDNDANHDMVTAFDRIVRVLKDRKHFMSFPQMDQFLSQYGSTEMGKGLSAALKQYYMVSRFKEIMQTITERDWHWFQKYLPVFWQNYTATTGGLSLYMKLKEKYIEARFAQGKTALESKDWMLADDVLRELSQFQDTEAGRRYCAELKNSYMYAKFDEIKLAIKDRAWAWVWGKYMPLFYANYAIKTEAGHDKYKELGYLAAQQYVKDDEDFKAEHILQTLDGIGSTDSLEDILWQVRIIFTGDVSSSSDKKNSDDAAAKGGIDFAQSNLDMQIRRDGAGMVLPVSQQNLENIRIDGLVPEILSVQPAAGSPLFNNIGITTQ